MVEETSTTIGTAQQPAPHSFVAWKHGFNRGSTRDLNVKQYRLACVDIPDFNGLALRPNRRRVAACKAWPQASTWTRCPLLHPRATQVDLDSLGSTVFETLFQMAWFSLGVYWLINDWNGGQQMLKHSDSIFDYLQCDAISGGETSWVLGQVF